MAVLAAACTPILNYRYKPLLTTPGADFLAALTIASGNEPMEGNSVTLLENGGLAFPGHAGRDPGGED